MSVKICKEGHTFEKTSSCPVCPICSRKEMNNKFGDDFPKIGAPAFRALDVAGISRLSDLIKFTEKELLALHGIGPKVLRLLRDAIEKRGKSFSK